MSQFDRLAQDVATFSLDTFPGQGPKASAAKCLAEAQEFAADPSLEEAGEKADEVEDLRKARWYIDREIQRLEAQRATQ